jgi:hypothetical protein
MFKISKNKIYLLVLGFILVLALFLRVYRIDVLMRFIWDEGRDLLAVRNIIVNKDLTLFGPFNEIGGHKDFFGVFHYYLILPSLWLANFSPVGPAVFTAILGVFAVGLTYFWVKKWQDQSTALAVSFILAVSPLVVRFTQWPWNPNTIGFFGILYLITLQKFSEKRNLAMAFGGGLLLGLLFQLHYFTFALLGAAMVTLFKMRKKVKLIDVFLFILGFILPNLSFVVFDITHQGFFRKIIFDSFVGSGTQKFFQISWQAILLGPFLYLWDVSTKFSGSKILGLLLLVATFVFGLSFKKRSMEEKQLLISWVMFLGMTSFFPTLLNEYHSGAMWVGLSIVMVWGVKKIFAKWWWLVLIIIGTWMIWANQFWRQPTWQENMPRLKNVGDVISKDLSFQKTSNVNIASFVDPETRGLRFRYFIDLNNQKLLGFDDYPRTEILYAITPHSWEETIQNPAWELDTFRQASASAIWQDNDWRVFRVVK